MNTYRILDTRWPEVQTILEAVSTEAAQEDYINDLESKGMEHGELRIIPDACFRIQW